MSPNKPQAPRTPKQEKAMQKALDKFGSDKGGKASTGEKLRDSYKENA